MNFVNLASSSSGNCYWVELERSSRPPVKIMIELGLPMKDIQRKCIQSGLNMLSLDCCLVTHNHSDHAKSAKEMSKKGFRVYGNEFVASSIRQVMHPGELKCIAAETYVVPISVEHDAPDPLGFVIYTDREKILFIADCKYWKADLTSQRFDYIIIEANYEARLLHFAKEEAEKNDDLGLKSSLERVFNAHMSIENCIKALNKMNLSKCKAIFLIHLSDRNARENVFKNEVTRQVGKKCFVAKKNGGFI